MMSSLLLSSQPSPSKQVIFQALQQRWPSRLLNVENYSECKGAKASVSTAEKERRTADKWQSISSPYLAEKMLGNNATKKKIYFFHFRLCAREKALHTASNYRDALLAVQACAGYRWSHVLNYFNMWSSSLILGLIAFCYIDMLNALYNDKALGKIDRCTENGGTHQTSESP